MNKILNILIFPSGTEVGMEIAKSLRYCKEVKLFSASSNVKNHAPYIFSEHRYLPPVSESNWLLDFNNYLKDCKIDFVFPANPFVIDALNKFRSKIAADLILNDSKVLSITRDKKNTYKFFNGKLPLPRLFSKVYEIDKFPVFVKPVNGYGAQGVHKFDSLALLDEFFLNKNPEDYSIQEYLPGEEYTVDCFSGTDGALLFHQGRSRERVRMGTSMHSSLVGDDLNSQLGKFAKIISEELKIVGAWFFQMKEDSRGELRLLEIEARIAGTMALNRVRGVNFALLSILQASKLPFKITVNSAPVTIDRSLKNRYALEVEFDEVFIDLDDTIICHGKYNLEIISFVYSCIQQGKKLILITKSLEKDLDDYLNKKRLKLLFDKILHLKETDSKADFILENSIGQAIFIDDSFSQRMEVRNKLGIPTFDPSMVESLVNDKIEYEF